MIIRFKIIIIINFIKNIFWTAVYNMKLNSLDFVQLIILFYFASILKTKTCRVGCNALGVIFQIFCSPLLRFRE